MEKDNALLYWSMGQQFLNLSYCASNEIAKKNIISVITEDYTTGDELDKYYQWTDINLGISTLFNFYHGIELMIKGFLFYNGEDAKGHRFSKLLPKLENHSNSKDFIKSIENYVSNIPTDSIISKFLSDNNIGIDIWYESLKYPELNNGKELAHYPLKYKGENGREFWEDIAKKSKELIEICAREYYRN